MNEDKNNEISAEELLKKLKEKMLNNAAAAQPSEKPQPETELIDTADTNEAQVQEAQAESAELTGIEGTDDPGLVNTAPMKYKFRKIRKEQPAATAYERPASDAAPAKADKTGDDDIDVNALIEQYLPKEIPPAIPPTAETVPAPEADELSSNADENETEGIQPAAPAPLDIDIKKRIEDAEAYVSGMFSGETPVGGLAETNVKDRAEDAESLEQEVSEDEVAKLGGESELDEKDVNLMIALGMDDELEKTVGIQKVKEIHGSLEEEGKKYNDAGVNFEKTTGEMYEYTSPSQNREVFKSFKSAYKSFLWKIPACAVLMLIAFFYENIGLLGGALPKAISAQSYPTVHVMLGLQLLVLGAAIAYKQLYTGLIGLLTLKPRPQSLTAVLVAVSVIYHIGLSFVSVQPNLKLYNFAVLLCILLTLVYDFINLKREIYNFDLVASKGKKNVLNRLPVDESELEHETFGDYLSDDAELLKINETSFVDGFFKRLREYPRNMLVLNAIIPAAIIIGLVFMALGIYKTKSVFDGISFAYATVIMCMPFSVFITYCYPFFKATKDAHEHNTAIIGETSLEEYSGISGISFDDKDVFPSYGVKVKSIKVYEDSRIDKVIYYASSLFHVVGGPLSDVFEVATRDLGHSENVTLTEALPDGLLAAIDGQNVYVGKASYLGKKGFLPIFDDEDAEIENSGDACIMFMAVNDRVVGKMYIRYIIDPEFEYVMKKLYKAGVCVGIKTFDPNIDDAMLSTRLNITKYPVKILKCRTLGDALASQDRADSGIVSKEQAKSLLSAFTLCDKVLHAVKTNLVLKVFSIMVSILIMTVLLTMGLDKQFTSLYAVVYQLFWMLPVLLISAVTV